MGWMVDTIVDFKTSAQTISAEEENFNNKNFLEAKLHSSL